jgi:hypothetical protein
MGRRGVTSKAVGSVADDAEGRELYLGYAREDRCALWLRLPDEPMCPRLSGYWPTTTFIRVTTSLSGGPTSTSPDRPVSGRRRVHDEGDSPEPVRLRRRP